MKIYVASSWRELRQQEVVKALLEAGHEVYDFRHPPDGSRGFHWSEISRQWMSWGPREFRVRLESELAKDGFDRDMGGLLWCDVCVHVVPSTAGRSSHLELGWACGSGRRTIVLLNNGEPELMYKMAGRICVTIEEVLSVLEEWSGLSERH